jgi:hypothetical protein
MVKQVRRVALLALLAAGAVSGCLFSPEKKAPLAVLPPEYPPAKTPNQALLNMITAYEARDSVGTEAIYDIAYEGSSTDLSAPTPAVVNLTRTDEKHHVGFLLRDSNIASISLDFKPLTWFRLPPDASDPADWAVLQVNSAEVQIQDVNLGTTWQSQNNTMLYTFIPTVTAPGDSLWKIIRWTEVRN